MRIYIVRHGSTASPKEEVFRGATEVPLSKEGKREAVLLGRYFGDKEIDRVFSGPLARARETAGSICRTTKAPLTVVDAFTDMSFGPWDGLTLREVRNRYPLEFTTWQQSPDRFRLDGAETLGDVRQRIAKGISRVLSPDHGNLVIVTHRVICKILVLRLLGISGNHFWTMKFDPASVTLVETGEGRKVLHFQNDTCHLKPGL
jgi:broad specificity phosphatase PhoE